MTDTLPFRVCDENGVDITEKLTLIGRRARALGHLHMTQRIFDRCCHEGRDINYTRRLLRGYLT